MRYKHYALLFISLLTSFYSKASFALEPDPVPHVIKLDSNPILTKMITVRANLKGQEGVFLFDTGAGISFLTPAFAQKIGCSPWGQMTGFRMTGERVDAPRCDDVDVNLQGKKLKAPVMGVIDILKFLPPNTPPLDGVIGLDLFAGQSITLSLKQKLLTVETPASLILRIKQGKQIPIRLVRDAEGASLTISVAVITPKGMAWMALDSGNVGRIVIAKHLAPLLNLDGNLKESQPVSLTIAGGIQVQGVARIVDTLIKDGNIGAQFFQEWNLTFDLSKGLAWAVPAK